MQKTDGQELEVWIDQGLCTGDGICAQYAPEVFELDVDGLAYVKDEDDELVQEPGAAVPVPLAVLRDVVDSAQECPGDCIHVRRVSDTVEIYGPDTKTPDHAADQVLASTKAVGNGT
jgi:ferredoxin